MRLQLKLALVDVRTGNWTMFIPPALADRALSMQFNREGSDQKQVEHLKQLTYNSAADEVVKIYTR